MLYPEDPEEWYELTALIPAQDARALSRPLVEPEKPKLSRAELLQLERRQARRAARIHRRRHMREFLILKKERTG